MEDVREGGPNLGQMAAKVCTEKPDPAEWRRMSKTAKIINQSRAAALLNQ